MAKGSWRIYEVPISYYGRTYEEGKKIAKPNQPKFGVMADELRKTHPHLVIKGEDGYLRVNYAQLSKELAEAA